MKHTLRLKRFFIHGFLLPALVFIFAAAVPSGTEAAPKAKLWSYWETYGDSNDIKVDHTPWNQFMKKYLTTNDPSGINLIQYKSVKAADRQALEQYIKTLVDVRITALSRKEQKAYWINLYNALTVKVILDHYPVESIRDIDLTKGVLSDGPWDAKLLLIEGKEVSLNDIEHRVLRPIFRDNRVHYAVNCASIGCPNLQPEAYTAENTDALLDRSAREYIANPRGVSIEGNRMYLSGIYEWFQEDFGDTEKGVKEHILKYAPPDLARQIRNFRGRIKYRYDWSLNE